MKLSTVVLDFQTVGAFTATSLCAMNIMLKFYMYTKTTKIRLLYKSKLKDDEVLSGYQPGQMVER
jgi:hypothetical protein